MLRLLAVSACLLARLLACLRPLLGRVSDWGLRYSCVHLRLHLHPPSTSPYHEYSMCLFDPTSGRREGVVSTQAASPAARPAMCTLITGGVAGSRRNRATGGLFGGHGGHEASILAPVVAATRTAVRTHGEKHRATHVCSFLRWRCSVIVAYSLLALLARKIENGLRVQRVVRPRMCGGVVVWWGGPASPFLRPAFLTCA